MARIWARKRNAAPQPAAPDGEPVESVRLDGDDHAWWVQEEVKEVWRPKARRTDTQPERDILAEHFGEDWRTSFGLTPTGFVEPERGAGSEAPREDPEPVERDPYEVLEIEPTATWDEIIAAHRHQARVHHPDLLFGQSPAEKAASEQRIRIINAAYKELRVRRGM